MARIPDKPHYRVVAALIEREGCYLITQRRPEARLPLLWEFPGGKVEVGESDTVALARELAEELGIAVDVDLLVLHVTHEYENYNLDLLVYRCTLCAGEPIAVRVHDVRWVAPEHLGDYPFPGADQQTVDALLADYGH